jgi:hypothetical protein
MGEGVALLMLHELASVAGEDAERLSDRLHTQEAEMKARAKELSDREKNLQQRERALSLQRADLEGRQKEVAAREQNLAAAEQTLALRLRPSNRPQAVGSSKPKLGRNEPCWCESGKKYKVCHLPKES